MPAIVNGGTGGELNPGFGGSRAPVATAIAKVRNTTISTGLGDALSAQTSYGWDTVSGSAHIVLPSANGNLGDTTSVSMGAPNVLQRFQGTIRQIDTTLSPHSVSVLAKGPLYALEEFKTDIESIQDGQGRPGLAFEDLVGGPTATLQQIVTAVLGTVGISYSLSNFDNPTWIYGTLAPEEFTWGTHETAAAYLHRVFEASAGYRLFDSSDGNVYLKQITAIPSGTADATFTLGIDIFADTQSSTSNLGQQSAVLVEGYDDGSGPATSGIIGTGSSAFRVFSNMIETDAFAQQIANFWLPQVNRNQKLVRLTTPRDDLLGPASTVYIDAAGGLGVSETMWIKSITTEVESSGAFTQHLVCVAGV